MILREIPKLLTDKECDYIISLIEKQNQKSMVAAGGKNIIENTRTSSTSNLNHSDKKVAEIHKRIADIVKKDTSYGEHLQGQKYEEGQYFRPHFDWFEGDAYTRHCLASGNRTHTLMVYLNDDFEGGGTDFPELDFTAKPEKGKALIWTHLKKDGTGDRDGMHEGQDVTKGTKYIITSWWRENKWDGGQDNTLGNEAMKAKEQATEDMKIPKAQMEVIKNSKKVYTSTNDFPKFTKDGFEKFKVPENLWHDIIQMYAEVRNNKVEEHFEGKQHFITGADKTSELMDLNLVADKRNKLHQDLLPMHEEWCGEKLNATYIYGIRSYLNNADLRQHTDRINTHHISSIIMLDKMLDGQPDWALDIQAHDGTWHKVYLEPGEMVLYESAKCMHGRNERFQGKYYRNFYIHYQLAEWTNG